MTTDRDLPWDDASIPDGFTIRRDGVYRDVVASRSSRQPGGQQRRVAGPVWVAGETRDPEGHDWGVDVHWLDRDGNHRHTAIPRRRLHEQGTTLAQDLADDGLAIVPGEERSLLAYLGSFDCSRRMLSVSRLGWLDAPDGRLAFVLPGEVISQDGMESVTFQPERHSPTARTIRAAGTLPEWQEGVAKFVRENDAFVFALCCGLAGPLVKPAGLDGGGFHFYGASSHGKTTALQVAASVWGCAGDPAQAPEAAIIRRWNATANGVEGLAAAHSDTGLYLDEIGSCTAKSFGSVIYNVTGGQGKAAMDQTRSLRPQRAWRACLLSTGEISSRQKIEEESRHGARAGQLLRLLDIPAGDMVADPHGLRKDEYVRELKNRCGRYFGTAGPAFVRAIVTENKDALSLRERIDPFIEIESVVLSQDTDASGCQVQLIPDNAPPEVRRAVRRFALVEVAGILAVRCGILPLTESEVTAAVRWALRAFLMDAHLLPDVVRGVEAVRRFLLRHAARFESLHGGGDPPVRDRAGWFDMEKGLFLLTEGGMQEACGEHDVRVVATALARSGLLAQNDSDRLKYRVVVPGLDRVRVYAIRKELVAEIQGEVVSAEIPADADGSEVPF